MPSTERKELESVEGAKVGDYLLRDVGFADDQGMVATKEKGLQKIMDRLYDTAKAYDMKMNKGYES